MKKFLRDFRDFAIRGNVAQLAVAIVIGNTFNNIVSSFVADIITPLISSLLGQSSFAGLQIKLPVQGNAEQAYLRYGNFIQNVIDFTIISLSIFLAIQVMKKLMKVENEQAIEYGPSEEVLLLRDIRDQLAKDNKK